MTQNTIPKSPSYMVPNVLSERRAWKNCFPFNTREVALCYYCILYGFLLTYNRAIEKQLYSDKNTMVLSDRNNILCFYSYPAVHLWVSERKIICYGLTDYFM